MAISINKVCVVGLGWLGLPLAFSLLEKDYTVAGTVSTNEKRLQLNQALQGKIALHQYQLYDAINKQQDLSIPSLSLKNAAMVLNIPPGRKNFQAACYIKSMKKLVDDAFNAGLKQLVFISTTSVFNNCDGVVNNTTPRFATTQSGKAHINIEDYLLSQYGSKVCIIRPCGLIGPNINFNGKAAGFRHPVFSLSQKTDIANGDDPVNLVHQADVIAVIMRVISNGISNQAFNVAALEHPSRREYYTWCAEQLKIAPPGFLTDTIASYNASNMASNGIVSSANSSKDSGTKRRVVKTIDASVTFEALGLTPMYESPFDMLPSN